MKALIKYNEDTWLKKFHFQKPFKMRKCKTYLSYLKYFDQARMEYFEELGLVHELYSSDFNLVNTEMNCQIRSEIKYGENIEVLIRTKDIEESRINLEYVIINSKTRDIIVVGNVGLMLMNKRDLNNITIPHNVRKTLYDYEKYILCNSSC